MDFTPSQSLLVKLRIIGKRAASAFPTIINSYELALRVKDLEGDIMECGVGKGSQIGAMALASNKRIWLVDSFEGIPLAGKQDTMQPGYGNILHDTNISEKKRLVTAGTHPAYVVLKGVHPISQVKAHLDQWGFSDRDIRFVKGWFENTVKDIKVKKLALLRLDGDLYSSTLVCLEHLYPKLVKGGYLIVDDYALVGCRRACLEYFGEDFDIQITTVEGGGGPVYIQK